MPQPNPSATHPDRESAQWATQQVVTPDEQLIHRRHARSTGSHLAVEGAWPSLFSDGPAPRLLDLAIQAQESKGELSLDDEIRRYIRVVRGNWIANWNCSVYTASGVLELTADSVEHGEGPAPFPPEFQKKVEQAAGDVNPAEYLRMLAEIVRILDREPSLEYGELPMGGWEFRLTFPYLFGFDAILMDEGDQEFADTVRAAVTNEHPYCAESAAAYTTEAQRALVLFPGPDGLKPRLYWATRARLQELIATVNEHMQREHS
ncbi:hypothetical protein OG564_28135 [Streptomyces sp. NBC_01280]|uniref:hypothetical protein n=1 Tax=unclassified Streptomyces TaxID=2593676 RepID=UPI002254D4AF|nr:MULTISPECIES: hypothetical protein [unclassified Streptomyces]MCX5437579.1 hypothetical protein [Streptomyces sp. NBC_00063]